MIVFATTLFYSTINAQSFYVKKYTVDDGLPASYIIQVYQDRQGFLWISTVNGLSRFDGKEFVNYGYENGMPHIITDAIYEDTQHRLWIGTRNGIAQVKRKNCIVYPVEDGQKINFVFRFHQLRSGALWALTGNGIYQFEKDHWRKMKIYPGLENSSCRNIIETDSGIILNYPYKIILKRNEGSFKLLKEIKDHKNPDPFFNIVFESNNQLYINTVDKLLEIRGMNTKSIFKDDLKDKYILFSYKDKAGRFWIYTLNDQLMISAPGDKQHFIYKKPLRLVSSFYEDRDGNMWVGCIDGLLKMRAVDYTNYQHLLSSEVNDNCSLIKIPNGNLLVSASGNNLFTVSNNHNENGISNIVKVKQQAAHKEMIDKWCSDDEGKVWLVFREQRDLFLLQNNEVKFLDGLVKENIHPLTGVAYSKKNHKLYVCADNLQYGNEKALSIFISSNDQKQIKYPVCIHYFSNGRLLVGTLNDGFFIIDERDNVFQVPKDIIAFKDAAGSTFFFDDPSGKFWIASSYGLVQYRWDEGMMPARNLVISTKQGLPNSGVRSIAFDNMNRIWAATLSGIVVIEIDSSANNNIRVNRLSEEQGISSQYWEESRLASDNQGNIWAGLTNQLLKFDPKRIQFEKNKPDIAIDNIQLNSKETDWSRWTDSTEEIMQIPYRPVLPYYKNTIGISYKGISFSYASSLEYSYKLDGADSNWSNATYSDFVSFVGLPAGHYSFKVRARKSNSEWSEPAAFTFSIKEPYWQTAWFRLLIILVIAVIIYCLYRYRVNQLRKLMNLRLKISRDLHDEVGSTLSGIGIISEFAKNQLENKNSDDLKESLHKISSNTDEMLGKMSDIIWAINPQNDTLEQMVSRLKAYSRPIAGPRGIHLHFDVEVFPGKIKLDMQQINNIYYISKEAINNAIKYSGCSNLYYKLRQNDREYELEVVDDGNGFNKLQPYTGNGLKNMHSRAAEIKAKLEINSWNGKGTSVKLFINIS